MGSKLVTLARLAWANRFGLVRLSVIPEDATDPVVVGANDERIPSEYPTETDNDGLPVYGPQRELRQWAQTGVVYTEDGIVYSADLKSNSFLETDEEGTPALVPSAPFDGSTYGRKDGGWGKAVTGVSGASPISATTGQTPVVSISAATQVDPGSMSAADKAKLDQATFTTAFTNQGGAGVLAWPAAGATLTIPTGGGTLGTAAFTAASAYATAAQTFYIGTTQVAINQGSGALALAGVSVDGSAGSIKSPATTGVATVTGMGAGATRVKTVRDANDTILELGGSYTPTGTWNFSTSLAAPTLPIGTATTGVATSAMLDSMVPACMGDGVTVTFLHDGVRTIYRKDWQGVQALSASARTNLLTYSLLQGGNPPTGYGRDSYSGTCTQGDSSLYTGDGAVAFSFVEAAQSYYFRRTDSYLANTTYRFSIFIEAVTGSIQAQHILYPGVAMPSGASVVFPVCAANPSGGATGIVTVGRLEVNLVIAATAGTSQFRFGCGAVGNVTGTCRLSRPMTEINSGITSFIPTTTAPVTITDYATAGGVATLAEAPLAGSILYGVSDRPRVMGAAIADATSEADAVVKLNLLLAEQRAQGKIAT